MLVHATGLPLYIFNHEQAPDSVGVPHCRVQRRIRFDLDKVMAWARRRLRHAIERGIDAKADPAGHYRSLQQTLASLPPRSLKDNAVALL